MNCKLHNKPLATEADMLGYSGRRYCWQHGDCRCPLCTLVCWDGDCHRAAGVWPVEDVARAMEGEP